MQCFQQQQQNMSNLLQSNQSMKFSFTASSSNSSSLSDFWSKIKTADHYNNACYEDIICHPIKPPYDGSPDQLIPFLNRLDICCQDNAWKAITYITETTKPLFPFGISLKFPNLPLLLSPR
jgi:hypothetical protein